MPLWNIYHTPDTFESEGLRADLARDITHLYSGNGGLPGFYVVVQFIPLPVSNVFIAGETRSGEGKKPFVRLVVEHMALHKHEAPEGWSDRFSKRIDDALKPYIADKGYDWEITVTDTAREFWRINGISPPPFKSEAEKIWAEAGRPSKWDNEEVKPKV